MLKRTLSLAVLAATFLLTQANIPSNAQEPAQSNQPQDKMNGNMMKDDKMSGDKMQSKKGKSKKSKKKGSNKMHGNKM